MHQAEDTLSIILPLPVQREVELLNRGAPSGVGVEYEVYRGPEQLLYGNKTCPTSMENTDRASIEDRSTCPYYYVISNDPFRYPVAIAEARCKCMYCFDDSTGDNLCEPVYFPKTILRRQQECLNGIYEYQPETYYIQNGCVCAKRRFVLTSKQETSRNNTNQVGNAEEEGTRTDTDDYEASLNATTMTNGATTNLPVTFQ